MAEALSRRLTPRSGRVAEARELRMTDVASRAGVSKMTVSRVLRHPEKVAKPTQERVIRAIDSLGYLPNLTASSLATSRTRIIAAIIPTITNSLMAAVVQGMSDVLRERGLHLLLGNGGFSLEGEERLVAAFLSRRPDGIYLTGTQHSEGTLRLLAGTRVRVVEGGNLAVCPIGWNVGFSNFAAARDLTRHLIARGYRTIAYVGPHSEENDRVRDRRHGYEAALLESGLSADPALAVETEVDLESGARAFAALADARPDIDAVFLAVDILAAGALFECQRRGWHVPKRVALAGFGDLGIASQVVPRLTTVRIPGPEIGRRAGLMLAAGADDDPTGERVVDLGYQLAIREST